MSSSPNTTIKKSLCICIDDFGLYPSINEAVLKCVDIGRVHAVSCLVGGQVCAQGAASLLARAQSHVDIGLHLDFTECSINSSNRHSIASLILKSHSGLLNRSAVRLEIRAQLDRFEKLFNRPPKFIDGHLHVHQFPVIRSELINEIKRRYADNKPWIRSTRSAAQNQVPKLSAAQKIKPFVIEITGASQLLSLLTNQGYRHNQDFAGVYDFAGGEPIFAKNLQHWLASISQGGLLMTHPGTGIDSTDLAHQSRQAEFNVMTSRKFDQWIASHNIELKAMSQII